MAGPIEETEETGVTAAAQPLTLEKAQEFAQFDLTARLTPYLDRHMMFPILLFLKEVGLYKQEDVTRAELSLLEETFMLDFAVDKYKDLGEEAPEALNERREEVIRELGASRERVLKLLEILEDKAMVKRIPEFKSITELCSDFGLEESTIEGLVPHAKLMFNCGNYFVSGELLRHYRNMTAQDAGAPMTPKLLSCLWGSLASYILNRNTEAARAPEPTRNPEGKKTEEAEAEQGPSERAADVIFKLDELLKLVEGPQDRGADARERESFKLDEQLRKMSKREVLAQKSWLLHWTLFAIFTPVKCEPKLLDFFLSEKSLSVISLSCPHLFRYVGACLILHKRLKNLMKDTVWIIHHESASYSDPITRFLLALYTDMDFDEAQRELQRCALVCKGDYFLSKHWAEFEENARLLIFETYCRIHQCINIKMIASKLNMEADEAELWIVKLIQNAKLDARIDAEKSRVVMSKAPPSVYQQVIEKTKNLSFRSTMLLSNLEKKDRERQHAA